MGRARLVNAIFWAYLWLSDALMPVVENQEISRSKKANSCSGSTDILAAIFTIYPRGSGLLLEPR